MDIKEFIINGLDKHPNDIVIQAMRQYKMSRPAIHKHLNALIANGQVIAVGRTRNKTYRLPTQKRLHFTMPLTSSVSESDLWHDRISMLVDGFAKNIRSVFEYGFTEMVNNAVDHSEAARLDIEVNFTSNPLEAIITDNGVGIFKKIKGALNLETEREAILHLTKGRLTTDPERHSGEGIFFTSRVFDEFFIDSFGIRYSRFQEDDWTVDTGGEIKGTRVTMRIAPDSPNELQEVFGRYAVAGGDFSFSKTQVLVELGLNPGETYISRSQAKRILAGLEKFKLIVLDFKRVEAVGQGFVDEVFRVFQERFPQIKISFQNANPNVEFMIQRSLPIQP